jgi:prepilin-type N-terminal cleavage/methylation domain-containing protein
MSAFTLIELLVVIAIIAILAAILFPSFRAGAGEGADGRLPLKREADWSGAPDVRPGLR